MRLVSATALRASAMLMLEGRASSSAAVGEGGEERGRMEAAPVSNLLTVLPEAVEGRAGGGGFMCAMRWSSSADLGLTTVGEGRAVGGGERGVACEERDEFVLLRLGLPPSSDASEMMLKASRLP